MPEHFLDTLSVCIKFLSFRKMCTMVSPFRSTGTKETGSIYVILSMLGNVLTNTNTNNTNNYLTDKQFLLESSKN